MTQDKQQRRRKREFSKAELEDMRVCAQILKEARLSQEKPRCTIRGWWEFLVEHRGLPSKAFADIQRYEAAGHPDKRRKSNSQETIEIYHLISRDYIKAVAPFTPYSEQTLIELATGAYPARSTATLAELIANTCVRLGDRFDQARRDVGVSEDELDNAGQAIVHYGSEFRLAALLGVSEAALMDAAIEQLRQREGGSRRDYERLLHLMELTRLSSDGKVIIPEALRTAQHWEAGQELVAIDVGDGILLKPKNPFPETTLAQVAGCLRYRGKPKSLDELEDAIYQGVMEQEHDRS